ncbi:MAG: ABC transporter permease [Verrucomicrobiales bacterium]|nr:ABC transporter permease [Verrucomicrobiales bacterium]MCP5558507.1 ABC transporter permease [Verrucomicrobiaceae bacterium]
MKRSWGPLIVTLLVLVFFYAPLVVLVVNSFNESRFGGTWEGFTWKWYEKLWSADEVWAALVVTLKVAVSATLAATVLGTLAAWVLRSYATRLQGAHHGLVMLPLVVPDLLMGMALLALFVSVGMETGIVTIWIAHVTFCISYVTMVVLGRLRDFDTSLIDAARDLGASPWRVARKVVLPILMPGIIAGALLAFTLSIDDFVITFFVSGPGTTTLPLRIASMMKTSRNLPIINALSSLLLCITFIAVTLSYRLNRPASNS